MQGRHAQAHTDIDRQVHTRTHARMHTHTYNNNMTYKTSTTESSDLAFHRLSNMALINVLFLFLLNNEQ